LGLRYVSEKHWFSVGSPGRIRTSDLRETPFSERVLESSAHDCFGHSLGSHVSQMPDQGPAAVTKVGAHEISTIQSDHCLLNPVGIQMAYEICPFTRKLFLDVIEPAVAKMMYETGGGVPRADADGPRRVQAQAPRMR
jgi:hypothetical protein